MYDPEQLTIPCATPGEHDSSVPHLKLTQTTRPDYSQWRESSQSLHGLHSHLHSRESLARDIAVYYGMISLMDKYIGRILDRLHQLQLDNDILVVFTTDHGHFFGQHGLIAKGPFHYEDMIRGPRSSVGCRANSLPDTRLRRCSRWSTWPPPC